MPRHPADGDGKLPFSEAETVFPRIRAEGDPVWTVLHEQKFSMMYGDKSVGDGTATTFDKVAAVLRMSNLEIDWRVPPPPPPPPKILPGKKAGSCVMETCGG